MESSETILRNKYSSFISFEEKQSHLFKQQDKLSTTDCECERKPPKLIHPRYTKMLERCTAPLSISFKNNVLTQSVLDVPRKKSWSTRNATIATSTVNAEPDLFNMNYIKSNKFEPYPVVVQQQTEKYLSYFEENFNIISRIGEGSFGDVYKVRSKLDGKYYAVKISKKPCNTESSRKAHLEEVKQYEKFSNNIHCVKLYKAWEQDNRFYLQFELCISSLASYCSRNKITSESVIWDILIDILLALQSLHDNQMIHLDIKLDNILIGFDSTYKLGDFGLVTSLKNPLLRYSIDGDPKYLAPETLQGTFSKAADIFSLGISILELAFNLVLPSGGQLWHELRNGILPEINSCNSLEISSGLLDIIKQMMQPVPDDRPDVNTLLEHPIIELSLQKRRRRSFKRTVLIQSTLPPDEINLSNTKSSPIPSVKLPPGIIVRNPADETINGEDIDEPIESLNNISISPKFLPSSPTTLTPPVPSLLSSLSSASSTSSSSFNLKNCDKLIISTGGGGGGGCSGGLSSTPMDRIDTTPVGSFRKRAHFQASNSEDSSNFNGTHSRIRSFNLSISRKKLFDKYDEME